MMERTVRIENISITNFKNVKKGSVSLKNKRKPYKASVLGIYGQNASGKTAVIDALALLKQTLRGRRLPSKYVDYINVDAEFSTLEFQFEMKYMDCVYDVWYQFDLVKNDNEESDELEEGVETEYKAAIKNEILSFSYSSNEKKIRKSVLIDTNTEDIFIPKTKFDELLGVQEESAKTKLQVTKKYTQITSRSFIFSVEMMNQFRKNCKNSIYMRVLEGLKTFAERELFIINTETTGLIRFNALPLSFKYPEKSKETFGNVTIPLDDSTHIPEEAEIIVKKVIDNMNVVLTQLVPGLTIGIEQLSEIVLKDGKIGKNIQLVSLKNGKKIPFTYESDGVKKIVSVLQLLIAVYNHPSVTVAIDELDAGIFEYLLGEILHIISEKGKGQLIFTSHNLRPLETIDKGFIAFTTVNPMKRYIRMTNVKENNNLRDFYFRDIVLGEQNETLYDPTNNAEIAMAFREAGEGVFNIFFRDV